MEVGGYQRPPLPNCWHSSLIRDEAHDGNNPGQSVRKVEGRKNSQGEVEGVGVQFPERKSFFQPNGKIGGRRKILADAKKFGGCQNFGGRQKIWRNILAGQMHGTFDILYIKMAEKM